MVPLMACVCATRGAVLEVGAGNWSTPVLHAYCIAAGRKLVSVDEDKGWIERYYPMRVCEHSVEAVKYDAFLPEAAKEQWSVVFLDQSPGHRRAADAMLFRDSATYILVHDYSGAEIASAFEPILDRWPYLAVAKFSPTTLILGNEPIPMFDRQVFA